MQMPKEENWLESAAKSASQPVKQRVEWERQQNKNIISLILLDRDHKLRLLITC
jgi:hypothetical protein